MSAVPTMLAPGREARIALLDADPDLGSGLEPAELTAATRRLLVPLITAARGPWRPELPEGAFALLVVDGVLRRELALHERHATELLGPGDVIDPLGVSSGALPVDERWSCASPVSFAVLDDAFLGAARVLPTLARALHRRLVAQAARTSLQAAIAQLGRVDLRVLALLWHLAERWGTVGPDGVAVGLRLTHADVGRLVGAQRPTVTLALGTLVADGDLRRREDGVFVLRPGSEQRLACGREHEVR